MKSSCRSWTRLIQWKFTVCQHRYWITDECHDSSLEQREQPIGR